jgi:hypothetical protein
LAAGELFPPGARLQPGMSSGPLRRFRLCADCTQVVAAGETCPCQTGQPVRATPEQPLVPYQPRLPVRTMLGIGAGLAIMLLLMLTG